MEGQSPTQASTPTGAVFLSYASQDAEAAHKIAEAVRAGGLEVFLDQSELRGGDAWDQKIRHEIHDCALFVPIVSQHTQRRLEGYFRHEWNLAIERTHHMAQQKPFLVPVVVDNTRDQEAIVPDAFRAVQWTRLPQGSTPPAFVERIRQLLSPDLLPLNAVSAATPGTGDRGGDSPGRLVTSTASVRVGTDRGVRSLAVLPFKPLTAVRSHESLGLGMADALIMRIGGMPGIELRPLSSVIRYGDSAQDPREVGRLLGADEVLEGWIQTDGERLRASVRLFEVESGRQRWADRFDEHLTDIFAIQDAIAERVAVALLAKVTHTELRQLRRHPTEDAIAYQLYVTGWSALTRLCGGNLEHALQCLEQAVSRDPNFALAHVCMADCYALYGVVGLRSPHDVFPKARASVLKALEIDPDLAEAHAELGHIQWVYDFEWRHAEESCRRALQINPHSAMAHHYLGLLLLTLGRFDDALEHVRHAQSLEPLAPNFNANIGMIQYYAGRYEAAIAQLEATLELDSTFDHARSFLGRALLRLGEPAQALAHFQRRTGITIGGVADIPAALALSGRIAEAEAELERVLRTSESRYVSPFDLATIHAALERPEVALDWLERAALQRAQPIGCVKHDPSFRKLRALPRFQAILKGMRLL